MDSFDRIYAAMRQAGREEAQGGRLRLLLGKILGPEPLRVEVDGTEQEGARFYLSRRLVSGYQERMRIHGAAAGQLTAETSGSGNADGQLAVSGELSISGGGSGQTSGSLSGSGSASWEGREELAVERGTLTLSQAEVTLDGSSLHTGDLVLLLTEDNETFYLLDKVVRST